MSTDLPIELVRSFVAIVNCGSLQNASEQVFVTPSGLSLQMKRLTGLLGAELLDRNKRGVRPTPAGLVFFEHARSLLAANDRAIQAMAREVPVGLRIGLVAEFAQPLLERVLLPCVIRRHPHVELELFTGQSATVLRRFERGELDLALCVDESGRGSGLVRQSIMWFGHSRLASAPVIPLVLQADPCPFRPRIEAALQKAGRRARVVIQTSGLEALRAAVEGGIGITAQPRVFTAPSTKPIEGLLPQLPSISYVVRRRASEDGYLRELANALEAAMSEL